jgi:hypothetical protein
VVNRCVSSIGHSESRRWCKTKSSGATPPAEPVPPLCSARREMYFSQNTWPKSKKVGKPGRRRPPPPPWLVTGQRKKRPPFFRSTSKICAGGPLDRSAQVALSLCAARVVASASAPACSSE